MVVKHWQAAAAQPQPPQPSGLDAEPENDTNRTGETHTVTATVYDQNGEPYEGGTTVNFEYFQGSPSDTDGNTPESPDRTCTTDETGSCSIGYTSEDPGNDRMCVWTNDPPQMEGDAFNGTCNGEGTSDPDDDPAAADAPLPSNDRVDVVQKSWQDPPQPEANVGSGVDAEPEDDLNQVGDTHTITATVYRPNGQPFTGGSTVHFEFFQGSPADADGNTPQTPDRSCQTDQNGRCSVGYTSNTPGTDRVCVWTNDPPSMQGNNTNGTCEGEGANDEDDDAQAADPASPNTDDVDVVRKTWQTQAVDPTRATRLDCAPETATNPTGSQHLVTCTATNQGGNTISSANIDVEATGANDPDNSHSPASPDFTCQTGNQGTCSFAHGPGNTSGTGTTTYLAWIDEDNSNLTVEADQAEQRAEGQQAGTAGNDAEPDDTDVVEKTWQAPTAGPAQPGTRLDCTPETAVNQLGTAHTFVCTPTNAQGQVGAANIDVEVVGANDPDGGLTPATPDFTCTTNGQTVTACSLTHSTNTASTAGTSTYLAWIDDDNNNTTIDADVSEGRDEATARGSTAEIDDTDVIEKTWQEAPVTDEPACDDGIDNDGDGATDFPADVNCVSPDDDSEAGPAAVGPCNPQQAGNITGRVIIGSGDDDVIVGTPQDDIICALAGDDAVSGGDGHDLIVLGRGADSADGGNGKDTIRGGAGIDTISGGLGNDLIVGGAGGDGLKGNRGIDTLKGGRGSDSLQGGTHQDILKGGGGSDTLRGGTGNDQIDGGPGGDLCVGGRGNDLTKRCE